MVLVSKPEYNKGQNPVHQFLRRKTVTSRLCCGLVVDLLPGSRQVRSKSVTSSRAGKRPLCRLCRVVSQTPLQTLVADLLAVSLTSP